MIKKETLENYFTEYGGYRMLSRKFDHSLPGFGSHHEARDWFRDLFGDKFMLTESFKVEEQICWSYVIIHNQEEWDKGMKSLQETGFASGMDFVMATQDVQIFDDGDVHIVH